MESDSLKEQIRALSKQYLPDVTGWRRHLHQNPELSFEEKETSSFVAEQLRNMNIAFTEGIGGYGLVGIIEGTEPETAVYALRADMDALPIHEKNDVPSDREMKGLCMPVGTTHTLHHC